MTDVLHRGVDEWGWQSPLGYEREQGEGAILVVRHFHSSVLFSAWVFFLVSLFVPV